MNDSLKTLGPTKTSGPSKILGTIEILGPLAWRNLWRNPRRTLITLIVVSVAVWSILAFSALMTAWSQSSRDATLSLLIAQGQIHASGYMDDPNIDNLMPPPDAKLLAGLNSAQIGNWASRLQLPAVAQSEYKTLPVTFVGVDPAAEEKISSIPGKIIKGRYLNGPADDGVVIGRNMAKRLKTDLGRRIILMSSGTDGWLAEQSFDVVGIYDASQEFEDTYVFTGRRAGQDFVGLDNQIAVIAFTVPDEAALAGVISALQAAAPGLDVRQWRDLSPILGAIDSTMGGVIFVWLGVMMVLISIGVINTQLMAVFERTSEFGLLQALGLGPHMVLMLVTLESALLIGLGVILGNILGLATVLFLSNGIDLSAFSQALEAFKSGNILYPKVAPMDYVIYPVIIWLLGVLVALWPAWRAQKISPVEAMRHAT